MLNKSQGTLKSLITFSGKGLHTGGYHTIVLQPADENTGIVFRRTDENGFGVNVSASLGNTIPLPLCTCIRGNNGLQIRTIEHLMAALYACGIDNLIIDVDGDEIPVLDGSASPFIKAIDEVGIRVQDSTRQVFKITNTALIKEGKRYIKIEPADALYIDITISLAKIGRLNWAGEITPKLFKDELSSARTFGRLKNGLLAQMTRFNKDPICLGANTKSALVIVGDKVLNKEGLRMPDEFIIHRVLDLIGDLMLSGGHVQGKITASSTAHRLNHLLLKDVFENNKYKKIC